MVVHGERRRKKNPAGRVEEGRDLCSKVMIDWMEPWNRQIGGRKGSM